MKKRADGRLQRKVTIKGHKPHIVYGHSKPELDRKEKEYRESLNKKLPVDFEYWLDQWWETHQTEVKYNTAQSYISPVKDVKAYFKDWDMREIKPSDIKEFLKYTASSNKAKQTIKLRKIVLSLCFDYAIEHDVDIINPARNVKMPKGLSEGHRKELTESEIQNIQDSKFLLANLLLYTGLRLNEALALRWIDISFKDNKIYVENSVLWKNNKPELDTPKTPDSIRYVPLLPQLRELLKPRIGKGFVFNVGGKLLEKKQFRSMWDKYCKDIERHVTPHQFRHTYATMLYYAGIDLKTAQFFMGHSKPDMLLKIYTHLREEETSSAAQKISTYIRGQALFF